MTHETSEVERIAEGLSEAQRQALEEICEDRLADGRSCAALHKRGVVAPCVRPHPWLPHGLNTYEATDLGLAVRRHLQEQQNHEP